MKSYLQSCTKEQFLNLLKEIGTTEEALRRDVQYLMDWMEQEPHLPNVKDEDVLAHALIFNKNRMEKTKKTLHLFYTAKARWPYLTEERESTFDQMEDFKRVGYFVPLPKLTPEGDRVVVFRLNKHSAEDLPNWEFVIRGGSILLELVLKVDCFRRLIVINDTSNMSAAVASMVVTVATKGPAVMAAKNIPARVGNIYIMNLHPIYQWLLNFMKNLLQPEISERFVIYDKEPQCLAGEIPKDILPPEFGGTEKPLDVLYDEFLDYCKQFKQYAASLADVKADLSKIPPDCKYKENEDGFGTAGTFRNLEIE